MLCANGYNYTITLSDNGVIHSFGRNHSGQLGLGHENDVPLPKPISNLPRIKQVSCGSSFSFCVDEKACIWSFGKNNKGQLGTGNTTDYNYPKKIENIPPVLYVDCGYLHTLIITNDSNLWSCGYNKEGQLCLGNQEDQSTFQQTSFSNIVMISLGYSHSLFQNDKEEIFSCGFNEDGELGLGHFRDSLVPTLIPNLPSNIVQFICGGFQNLFLDVEGNVFSVGSNHFGSLGLGHNKNQNVLNQIPNIPPIKFISSIGYSCYLIDWDGNVWSFGYNCDGQLGHADKIDRNVPTKIENLKNIQQVSHGSTASYFLLKDSENTIFVAGRSILVTENEEPISKLQIMQSKYSDIWGERTNFGSRAKSARK